MTHDKTDASLDADGGVDSLVMNSSYGKIGADSFDVLPGSKCLSLWQSVFLKKWINVGKFWDYLMTCENYIFEYTSSSLGNSKIGKSRNYYRFICNWLCIYLK